MIQAWLALPALAAAYLLAAPAAKLRTRCAHVALAGLGHAAYWLGWRRRHQARARWHHQCTRLSTEAR